MSLVELVSNHQVQRALQPLARSCTSHCSPTIHFSMALSLLVIGLILSLLRDKVQYVSVSLLRGGCHCTQVLVSLFYLSLCYKIYFFSVTMERYLQILNAKCATSVPTFFSVKVKRARIGHVRAVVHGGVSGLRHCHWRLLDLKYHWKYYLDLILNYHSNILHQKTKLFT